MFWNNRIEKAIDTLPVLKAVVTGKTTAEVIEEIHETFNTEVDRLLAYSKIKGSTETKKEVLLAKSGRLNSLGFSNTKDVIESNIERQRIGNIESENSKKDNLKETINYFSGKYPLYKFITEASVKSICKKYGLVYGEVSKFKGFVPENNLKDIEAFKIEDGDKCCEKSTRYDGSRYVDSELIGFNTMKLENDREKREREAERLDIYNFSHSSIRRTYNFSPLEIAAPVSDFDLSDSEVKDFKLSGNTYPDPIVLQPVFFKDEKHYLIVTAWGDEASDELVMNPSNN